MIKITDNNTRKQLKELVELIQTYLVAKNWKELERLLEMHDIAQMEPGISMALVRVNAVARGNLKNWEEVTSRVWEQINSQSLPADDIMVGLVVPKSGGTPILIDENQA